MYNVYVLTYDNVVCMLGSKEMPAEFPTQNDAWDLISEIMQEPNHPKMAWIKEAAHANP